MLIALGLTIKKFNVHVPDEVELRVELEVETDEREHETELKW